MKHFIILLASGTAFAVISAGPAFADDDHRILRHLGQIVVDHDRAERYGKRGFHDDDDDGRRRWSNPRFVSDDDDDDDDGGRRRRGGRDDDDDDD